MKLAEQQNGCVTQDLKISNAVKIVNDHKFLTLENVVNKTNVKLGGLNYQLDAFHITSRFAVSNDNVLILLLVFIPSRWRTLTHCSILTK